MANFADLPFLSRPQPVLAHPLLQTETRSFNIDARNAKEASNDGNEQKQHENPEKNEETDEVAPQFLDPLGAAINEPTAGASSTRSKENGSRNSRRLSSIDAEVGPLDNTLAKPDEAEEQMEWPVTGLEPTQLVGFRPWHQLRQRILEQFTTGDRLTLESSFLTTPEQLAENGTGMGQYYNSANKRQQQLQQRQRISAVVREKKRIPTGKEAKAEKPIARFYDLNQTEWCRKLVELRRQLLAKWKEESRLDCIQLMAELLAQLTGNICSAQFYPAQFVHVTDLLDLFGWLVWQRLLRLAQEERRRSNLGPLPNHWTINDVLGETRLKARNWFGKINQTVKMLAPRIYLLAAILPCQRFMDPWPAATQENALELSRAVQQVQHPLISSYLRCYLCRAAMRVQPADRAPHWKCLNDWLQTYTQQPISLLWPAMEWVIQCVSYTAVAYEDLHPLWEYCRRMDKRPVVLVPMLNALPRLYLGEHALEACRIVTGGSEIVTGEELCALGRNLLEAEIPHSALKPILRSAWKRTMRLGSLKEYLGCCECWCLFVVRHFTANELQVVLENVLRKLQQDKYELYHPQLLSILTKVFTHSREVRSLLGMEIFAKFFDIFRSAPAHTRQQAAQVILEAIVEKHTVGAFGTDIGLGYQVLSVCQLLHDSLEQSAPGDQISHALSLICASLDRTVQLQTDPDQCMAFLVACRAELANWDGLQRYVIRRVQAFTLYIVRSVRYTNSRAAFLQGCLANLFISIPSLANPLERIELALQSAQIALAALSFLQADSFIEFTLDQFTELHSTGFTDSGEQVHRLGTYFLATLANVPNAEGHEPLKHFRRFMEFLLSFEWPSISISTGSNQHIGRVRLLLNCLQFLFNFNSTHRSGLNKIPEEFSISQFEWSKTLTTQIGDLQLESSSHEMKQEENQTEFIAEYEELIERIAEAIEPHLLNENAPEAISTIGMELLELIALFGNGANELPPKLRGLARTVFKKCLKKASLAARVNRLKAANPN